MSFVRTLQPPTKKTRAHTHTPVQLDTSDRSVFLLVGTSLTALQSGRCGAELRQLHRGLNKGTSVQNQQLSHFIPPSSIPSIPSRVAVDRQQRTSMCAVEFPGAASEAVCAL